MPQFVYSATVQITQPFFSQSISRDVGGELITRRSTDAYLNLDSIPSGAIYWISFENAVTRIPTTISSNDEIKAFGASTPYNFFVTANQTFTVDASNSMVLGPLTYYQANLATPPAGDSHYGDFTESDDADHNTQKLPSIMIIEYEEENLIEDVFIALPLTAGSQPESLGLEDPDNFTNDHQIGDAYVDVEEVMEDATIDTKFKDPLTSFKEDWLIPGGSVSAPLQPFVYTIPMPGGGSWSADFSPLIISQSTTTEVLDSLSTTGTFNGGVLAGGQELGRLHVIVRGLLLVVLYYGMLRSVVNTLVVG